MISEDTAINKRRKMLIVDYMAIEYKKDIFIFFHTAIKTVRKMFI
jgi:hypothetical protein